VIQLVLYSVESPVKIENKRSFARPLVGRYCTYSGSCIREDGENGVSQSAHAVPHRFECGDHLSEHVVAWIHGEATPNPNNIANW